MRGRRAGAPRPLSPSEVELIEALLGGARGGGRRYLGQLERATVVGGCGCGCPSIDLDVEGCSTEVQPRPLVFADGESPEGFPVGIILWVRGTCLSGLEVHSWDGSQRVRLPSVDTLTGVRRS